MIETTVIRRAKTSYSRTATGTLLVCCLSGCPTESGELDEPHGADVCNGTLHVGLLDGRDECGEFTGSGGAWAGQPLFSLPDGYLARFCRYRWEPEDAAVPDVGALPDADDRVVGLVRDCPVVTPQGESAADDVLFRELLQRSFRARVGQPPVPSDVLFDRVTTLTLVDTIPETLVATGLVPNSRHGLTLRELLQGLVCDEGRCIAKVSNVLGLPRLGDDHDRTDLLRGGHYGSLSDLARGVVEATAAWQSAPSPSHLVTILAVGWEPREQLGPLALLDAPLERLLTPDAIATVPVPVQAIVAALVHASCKDVLVIASAGNESAASCEQSGPVGPGFLNRLPAPDADQCARLGFGSDAGGDVGHPLLHSVSHVGLDGAPLSNARSGATASLVAPGVAFGADASAMLTGSSVAAAATAVTAAWVWSYFPELTGAEVMDIVHESGSSLPGGGQSDFQFGARPLEVRQVSSCNALVAACKYTAAGACMPLPGCAELVDSTQQLAVHGANMLACTVPDTERITLGASFAAPGEATNACGRTSVTWPATALPETTTSSWPSAEPTPPVTYCPRCIAVFGGAPQRLTAGLALTTTPAADDPVFLEVKTSQGVHQYLLPPSTLLSDRTNIVDILPAAPWPDVTGARLVYFVRTLRGELITRGDPLLVLPRPDGEPTAATCASEDCGDNVVQAPELCDDGNMSNTDACLECRPAFCGDGYVLQGLEQCDDGNRTDDDICSNTCSLNPG